MAKDDLPQNPPLKPQAPRPPGSITAQKENFIEYVRRKLMEAIRGKPEPPK